MTLRTHRFLPLWIVLALALTLAPGGANADGPPTIKVNDPSAKYLVTLSSLPPGRMRIIFSHSNSEDTRFVEYDPYASSQRSISLILGPGTWEITSWSDPIRESTNFSSNHAWKIKNEATSCDPSSVCILKVFDDTGSTGGVERGTLQIRIVDSPNVDEDSRALGTPGSGGPPLSGRAFGSGAAVANELLGTIAEVIVEKARGRATKVLRDRVQALVCNELRLPPATNGAVYRKIIQDLENRPGGSDNTRLFPSVCTLVKTLRLEDMLGAGRKLLTSLQSDLALLLTRSMAAAVSAKLDRSQLPDPSTKILKDAAVQVFGRLGEVITHQQKGLQAIGPLAAQQLLVTLAEQRLDELYAIPSLDEKLRLTLFGLQVALATMQQCHKQHCDARLLEQTLAHSLQLYAARFSPVGLSLRAAGGRPLPNAGGNERARWLGLVKESADLAAVLAFLREAAAELDKVGNEIGKIEARIATIKELDTTEPKKVEKCIELEKKIRDGLHEARVNIDTIRNTGTSKYLDAAKNPAFNELIVRLTDMIGKIDVIDTATPPPAQSKSDGKPPTAPARTCQSINGDIQTKLGEAFVGLVGSVLARHRYNREALLSTNQEVLRVVSSVVGPDVMKELRRFVDAPGLDLEAVRKQWPQLSSFVQRGLLVLAPVKGATASEQLVLAIDLLFDVLERVAEAANLQPGQKEILPTIRLALLAAARSDVPGMLAATTQLLPSVYALAGGKMLTEPEQEPFKQALRIVAGTAAYLGTYQSAESASPEQIKAQHAARKRAIESLIDEATRRSGRGGETIVSLGASAGLGGGGQYQTNPHDTGWVGGGYPPQLSLPMGLAVQILPGGSSGCNRIVGLHSQLVLLDVAQYVNWNTEASQIQPAWSSALSFGLQVGALFGIPKAPHIPIIVALDARFVPTLFRSDGDGQHDIRAFRIGAFLGTYIPFFDFN
jgi:hypothetical protein